ncbi:protein DpdE [Mycolicibacterium phocaicum]|uniref:protein DpdE n=1 Tax=Mycolicibacterium phocaicum TaxID=319706 RepID=UPI001CFB151D|nr:protein DpdE [Mycolicibacterium phocaicum]UCZ61887.1 hypothetical protein LHJ73_06745 [Mycolicibacterium phocaicum]
MSARRIKPAAHFFGRWLRAEPYIDLGFGFCKGERHGKLVLSYVDVPNVAEEERLVARDDIVESAMPRGTRVWVPTTPYGWHAGVVDRPLTGNRYRVALVGRGEPLSLPERHFKVRLERPLENPARAVANGLVEAPTYYEARSALLDELVRQRRVSRGLTAAMSAPIELFQHQLDTAARVLGDPVMRYLLADEVGLGKTIEAGIVIRQLLIDNPAANILVVCPDSLRGQWVSELRNRMHLRTAIARGNVQVVPHSALGRIAAQSDVGLRRFELIVIDEAHNLLKGLPSGSVVERHLSEVDGLLALSATPMRSDLDTFRRLLALVDPVAFASCSLDDFQARVDERERSAADVQVLSARRASIRQKTQVLDSIESSYSGDPTVTAMVSACRGTQDPLAPAWRDLADYVREIYRLSRRMIRNRRGSALTRAYRVAGRVPRYVEVVDPARPLIDEFLETYRLRLTNEEAGAHRYMEAVVRGLAGPTAMLDYLAHPAFEADKVFFEMTAARLEMVSSDGRLRAAAEVVAERVGLGYRVVVTSAFPVVLDRFESIACELVDYHILHRHFATMPPAQRDREVEFFIGSSRGGVLLADSSVDEGRNLQAASVLVNLDLPLDVNQLEQRIGRLDRFTDRSEPADVVVFTEPSSAWVCAHIELLRDGIGVLNDSVSTVQRLLAAVLGDLEAHLIWRGVEALQVDLAELREQLEVEREDIDLLEELESIESATVFNDEAIEELLEYEAKPENLRSSVRRLTIGVGALALTPDEDHRGVVRFGNARNVGLTEDEARVLEELMEPKAFDRSVALENSGVTPFRIGDPLVDWLQQHLVVDERGRASAIARPDSKTSIPALWLHCEFLIEFDPDQGGVDDWPSRRRLARRGETHLQPIRVDTWTDPVGRAPDDVIDAVLRKPFDRDRDAILRGASWQLILDEMPAWSTLCEQSATVAWAEVRSDRTLASTLHAALNAADQDSARRIAILEARSLRLPIGSERDSAELELQRERATADAVRAGIQNPSIRMVACGACVLCPEEYFE